MARRRSRLLSAIEAVQKRWKSRQNKNSPQEKDQTPEPESPPPATRPEPEEQETHARQAQELQEAVDLIRRHVPEGTKLSESSMEDVRAPHTPSVFREQSPQQARGRSLGESERSPYGVSSPSHPEAGDNLQPAFEGDTATQSEQSIRERYEGKAHSESREEVRERGEHEHGDD